MFQNFITITFLYTVFEPTRKKSRKNNRIYSKYMYKLNVQVFVSHYKHTAVKLTNQMQCSPQCTLDACRLTFNVGIGGVPKALMWLQAPPPTHALPLCSNSAWKCGITHSLCRSEVSYRWCWQRHRWASYRRPACRHGDSRRTEAQGHSCNDREWLKQIDVLTRKWST